MWRRLVRQSSRALVAGTVLTALFAWGPVLLARRWSFAAAMGPNYYFTHNGTEFSGRSQNSYPAWIGYEQIALTPSRGRGAAPATSNPKEIALAQAVVETDLRVLGPMAEDPFVRPGIEIQFHAGGFPLRCVEGSSVTVWRGATARVEDTQTLISLDLRPNPSQGLSNRFLPIGIKPQAALLNIAAWTAFWFAAAACINVLRRRLKRAPNSCPTCGYDRRGTPSLPCPECGDTNPPVATTIHA